MKGSKDPIIIKILRRMRACHHDGRTVDRDRLLTEVQFRLLRTGCIVFLCEDLVILVRLTYRGFERHPLELGFLVDGIIECTAGGWYITKNRRGDVERTVSSWDDVLQAFA